MDLKFSKLEFQAVKKLPFQTLMFSPVLIWMKDTWQTNNPKAKRKTTSFSLNFVSLSLTLSQLLKSFTTQAKPLSYIHPKPLAKDGKELSKIMPETPSETHGQHIKIAATNT